MQLRDFAAGVLACLLLVLSTVCAHRLRREQTRCQHTAYEGGAEVLCITCRRERERLAEHVHRATTADLSRSTQETR